MELGEGLLLDEVLEEGVHVLLVAEAPLVPGVGDEAGLAGAVLLRGVLNVPRGGALGEDVAHAEAEALEEALFLLHVLLVEMRHVGGAEVVKGVRAHAALLHGLAADFDEDSAELRGEVLQLLWQGGEIALAGHGLVEVAAVGGVFRETGRVGEGGELRRALEGAHEVHGLLGAHGGLDLHLALLGEDLAGQDGVREEFTLQGVGGVAELLRGGVGPFSHRLASTGAAIGPASEGGELGGEGAVEVVPAEAGEGTGRWGDGETGRRDRIDWIDRSDGGFEEAVGAVAEIAGAGGGVFDELGEAGDFGEVGGGELADDGVVDAALGLVVADEVVGVQVHEEPWTALDDGEEGARGVGIGEEGFGDLDEAGAVAGDGEAGIVDEILVAADVGRWAQRLLQDDVAFGGDADDLGGGAAEEGLDGEADGELAGALGRGEGVVELAAGGVIDLGPDAESGGADDAGDGRVALEDFVNDAAGAVGVNLGLGSFTDEGEVLEAGKLGRRKNRNGRQTLLTGLTGLTGLYAESSCATCRKCGASLPVVWA